MTDGNGQEGKRRVVVTGMGLVSPVGNDVQTAWENLLDGVSGGGPVTVFEADESLERCVNTSGEDRVADQREPLSGLKGVLTRRAARRPAAVGLAP